MAGSSDLSSALSLLRETDQSTDPHCKGSCNVFGVLMLFSAQTLKTQVFTGATRAAIMGMLLGGDWDERESQVQSQVGSPSRQLMMLDWRGC